MNKDNLKLCEKLVPSAYVQQGGQALKAFENTVHHLLEQRRWPDDGWTDANIELLIQQLSAMDSNNFPGNCGVGERESRIASHLVARRHFYLGHGIGRSGDITAVQPKAAGSSIIMKLTNAMLLDLVRFTGAKSAKSAFLVPMATGMTLTLCMMTFRSMRPSAKYVIWPRIDQKSCFKSIITSGFEPLIIENVLEGDELRTNLTAIRDAIDRVGAESVCCVMTTTSCFAPRAPDRLEEVAKICAEFDIPHLVNNAYGLQSSKCMHLIEQARRVGRLDLFVQSTDKNLLVPVGGAVVAGFDETLLEKVGKMYPGRASGTPTLDVFITLLALGRKGYRALLQNRKELFTYLHHELGKLAKKYKEKVLATPHNSISIALSLNQLPPEDATELGSMLFTRFVSGTRVVPKGDTKEVSGYTFEGFGSHSMNYHSVYLTAAAALGVEASDVDQFIKRLDKTFHKLKKSGMKRKSFELEIQSAPSEDVVDSEDVPEIQGKNSENSEKDSENSVPRKRKCTESSEDEGNPRGKPDGEKSGDIVHRMHSLDIENKK